MIINNNIQSDRIKTKKELITELNNYKSILSDRMYLYFKQLIDLDFSVMKNYISIYDRKVLSSLDIYNKIMFYNIYNKALNLFNETNDNLIIKNYNTGYNGLSVCAKVGDKEVELYNFTTKSYKYNGKKEIPEITLYKTCECSDEIRDKEIHRITVKLDELSKEKNPYKSEADVYGGPDAWWDYEHNRMVKKYEDLYKKIYKRKLTDEDKKEIEITYYFNKKIFNDYGLTLNNFDENKDYLIDNSFLEKTLIKKMPNINIVDKEKYI